MSKTLLITGANRGIGLEMTTQAAKKGDQVIACVGNVKTTSNLVALRKKISQSQSLNLMSPVKTV